MHRLFTAVEIGNMLRKSYCAHARRAVAFILLAAHGIIGNLALASGDEPVRDAQQDLLASSTLDGRSTLTTRPRDQLWLVSCRGVSYGRHDDDLDELSYVVHQPGDGWTPAGKAAFRAADPATNTCILVLGNGYSAAQTRSLGHTAYRRLVDGLPPECGVRFVIWSWPSDHTDQGPIQDLRTKAAWTPQVAFCLARWLDEMPLPGQVSLLGTSFGGRIVLEALELRANGRLGNLHLEAPSGADRPAFHVVLISAAVDNDWLLPGRRLGGALSQTDRVLFVNNSSDNVLKRYHWLYGRRSRTSAIGNTGPRVAGEFAENVFQIDAAPIIGRHHGCAPYFDSPSLAAAMRSRLFELKMKAPQLPLPGLQIPLAVRPASDDR